MVKFKGKLISDYSKKTLIEMLNELVPYTQRCELELRKLKLELNKKDKGIILLKWQSWELS